MKSHVSPATWDEVDRMHSCCGSRSPNFHLKDCKHYKPINNNPRPIPKIEKENPLKIRVLELKEQGLNSAEVASRLALALPDINKLYA